MKLEGQTKGSNSGFEDSSIDLKINSTSQPFTNNYRLSIKDQPLACQVFVTNLRHLPRETRPLFVFN